MTAFTRAVALRAAAGAVVGPALAGPARAQTAPIRLHVAANPADDMTSVLYAQRAGLFAAAGLDVDFLRITSTAGLPAAVAGGTYDIAKTSLTSLFAARERGLLFKIVAPAAMYDDGRGSRIGGFLVANDVPPPSGRDFEGKTVSVIAFNGIGQVALAKWIRLHGGDAKSVQFVELPMSAALAAIEQRRVFAAECANPILAQALATGKVRLVPAYGAIARTFLFSVWFATADWVAKHPDASHRFAAVVARAASYTNAHPAETAPLLAEATGIPRAVIDAMPRVANGIVARPSQVQPVIDAAAAFGTLAQPFPASDLVAAPR